MKAMVCIVGCVLEMRQTHWTIPNVGYPGYHVCQFVVAALMMHELSQYLVVSQKLVSFHLLKNFAEAELRSVVEAYSFAGVVEAFAAFGIADIVATVEVVEVVALVAAAVIEERSRTGY